MTHSTTEYGPLWDALTDASRYELREMAHALPPIRPAASETLVSDLDGASVLLVGSAWRIDEGQTPLVGVVAPGLIEWIRANPDA
jgi:hypothetical protein